MIKEYQELKKKNGFLDVKQEYEYVVNTLYAAIEVMITSKIGSAEYKKAQELHNYFVAIYERLDDEMQRGERTEFRKVQMKENWHRFNSRRKEEF